MSATNPPPPDVSYIDALLDDPPIENVYAPNVCTAIRAELAELRRMADIGKFWEPEHNDFVKRCKEADKENSSHAQ